MDHVFAVSATFPTLIFSIALGILMVYWLIGLLGMIDLDLAPDIDADLDVDADTDIGGLASFFLTFGLTGIPFSLIFSIIVLICWLISFYCQYYLLTFLPEGLIYYLAGAATMVVIFFISLPITAVIIRPMRGMFTGAEAVRSNQLVGQEATIATSRVDHQFGQARIINAGAELLVDVRCDPHHQFKLGDKALVIDYNAASHSYIVTPYPQ